MDDAEAEGFVEVDQMEQCVRLSEKLWPSVSGDRAQIANVGIIDSGCDCFVEVLLVLHDAVDQQVQPDAASNVDGVSRPLSG